MLVGIVSFYKKDKSTKTAAFLDFMIEDSGGGVEGLLFYILSFKDFITSHQFKDWTE